MCAIDGRDRTESSGRYDLAGVVEPALARALVLAAEAKRWDVVVQIAGELRRRDATPASLAASAGFKRASDAWTGGIAPRGRAASKVK